MDEAREKFCGWKPESGESHDDIEVEWKGVSLVQPRPKGLARNGSALV